MANFQKNIIGKVRTVAVILFLCLTSFGFFYPRFASKNISPEVKATPTQRLKAKTKTPTESKNRKVKYSEFPHSIKAHNIACSSCHKFPSANWKQVRKADAAFPDVTDYPKHESCLNCHKQQFFGSAKPVICAICHTNPSPNNSARHPFPNPREKFDLSAKGKTAVSDFAISFAHDKHIEIVSQNANPFEQIQNANALFVKVGFKKAGEESCAVCHQTYEPQGDSVDEYFTKPPAKLGDDFWLKKGTFKTTPISHASCFTCHSKDVGILPAPSNCAACHKLKPNEPISDFDAKVAAPMKISDKIMMTAWRKRDSSATFRHEFSSHADLECASCHNVTAMNTLDFKTKKVAVTSCNLCHITATADDGGILNFEVDARKKDTKFQCVKCHLAFGKSAIPDSHFKAIAAQTGQ
jgi:Class III cytochrome C family